ncbi:Fic family protein [Stenotrophomonas sp. ATs4]|uniref:Fic family protein n=1 Tax=Stenotrophomonas sp. ATs4 TaxID=3402766 RepID=UPI003F716337
MPSAVEIHPGCLFTPLPLIKEAADPRIWEDHGVVVSSPQPLSGHTFSSATHTDWRMDMKAARALLLITARFNRVHKVHVAKSHSLAPSAKDRIIQSIRPLAISDVQDWRSFLEQMTQCSGIAPFQLRSDRSWVGAASPLEASLVCPSMARVPQQMADLVSFLADHLDNPNEEIDEAAAFQFLTIHPLHDGNGRTARTLLIKMAARKQSLYPLYIAWRLMFDKIGLIRSWRDRSLDGGILFDANHYIQWRHTSSSIGKAYLDAEAAGCDTRVLDCLTAFGEISPAGICALNSTVNQGLSAKIVSKHEDCCHTKIYSETLRALLQKICKDSTSDEVLPVQTI